MKRYHVWAMYFSGTGTTKKIVSAVAAGLAARMETEAEAFDFSLPEARAEPRIFSPGDLVVFGTPVYAGRVPNVLLKYIRMVAGNGALAVPVVLFGNRDYDDALIELKTLLEEDGFCVVAGAAFVGEHSFSTLLAAGRPDRLDMEQAAAFAGKVYEKLKSTGEKEGFPPLAVRGETPLRPYYQPRDGRGNSIDIRRVLPRVNERCNNCGLCAGLCPMGSIRRDNVREYTGICIKCCACVKGCPRQARYFDDPNFLYHQRELERMFRRRAEPELFW